MDNNEQNELDRILAEFDAAHPNLEPMFEGWPPITADDLKDYQGR